MTAETKLHPSECTCSNCVAFREGIPGAKRGYGPDPDVIRSSNEQLPESHWITVRCATREHVLKTAICPWCELERLTRAFTELGKNPQSCIDPPCISQLAYEDQSAELEQLRTEKLQALHERDCAVEDVAYQSRERSQSLNSRCTPMSDPVCSKDVVAELCEWTDGAYPKGNELWRAGHAGYRAATEIETLRKELADTREAYLNACARTALETNDAEDAAKWRALRNSARITAMGSAGLFGATFDRPDAHVTLNFWTHNEGGDSQDTYGRHCLDLYLSKALRLAVKANGVTCCAYCGKPKPILSQKVLCKHGKGPLCPECSTAPRTPSHCRHGVPFVECFTCLDLK